MKIKALALAVAAFLAVASCAPKREAVAPEAAPPLPPPPPSAPEKLVLPELPPEPGAPKEAAPSTAAPSAVRVEEEDERQYIILNFENTDIRTIIDTFGEILDINYILPPGISGTVTIQSYNKFPVDDLFHIFLSILEINGLTAIEDGAFYRIVPIDTARQQPLDVSKGREAQFELDSSFITQLIPLKYIKSSEVATILRNLMPRGTDLIVYEPTNMLIATALPSTIIKFMKIIEALDVPETESEATRTFVYHVENGEARKLADLLKTLFPPQSGTTATTAPATAARPRRPASAPTEVVTTAEALPGEIGDVTFMAYEDINALIIKTTPKTYVALLDVLRKIDIPVKQVVIEVLIAEITLTDQSDFGLQWLLKSGATTAGFTTKDSVTESTLPSGLTSPVLTTIVTGTIDKTFVDAVISALAGDSRVNVLASPHILALDNKEAEMKIGDEVPTATGLTQQPATGGGTTLVTSGQIQYRTVGTILTVTPHITEKGKVSMKLVVESSSIGQNITLGTGTFPSFATRRATTSAVVQSGKSLFIGGLISEDRNLTRSGLPFLFKMPVLGFLFGTTSDKVTKRELLVMVTPHVIDTQEDADEIAVQFQNRVKTIKNRLYFLDETMETDIRELPAKQKEGAAEETAPEAPKQP